MNASRGGRLGSGGFAVVTVLTVCCSHQERGTPARPESSSTTMPSPPRTESSSTTTPSPPRPESSSTTTPSPLMQGISTSEAPASREAPPSRPCHLLVIGDSLTDPRAGGGRYLDSVRKQCRGCSVTNLARGGWMVNQMRRHLSAFLETSTTPYSHLVVFGGVNDLYSDQTAGRSLARIQGDLDVLYELGQSRGMTVVAITVSPWGGFRRWFTAAREQTTTLLNSWIVNRVIEGKVNAAVDTSPLLGCGTPLRLCPEFLPPAGDGLHFGPPGHQRLGWALVSALGGDFCQVSPLPPTQP